MKYISVHMSDAQVHAEAPPSLWSKMRPNFEDKFFKTRFLLYMIFLIEGADMNLMPVTFRAFEKDLGLSPSQLANLTIGQAMFQAISAPFWGALADRGMERKTLLLMGCVGWGIFTVILGAMSNIWMIFALRCVNGFFLASLGPVAQSTFADVTTPLERGTVFGLAGFFMEAGRALAAVSVTPMSNTTIMGMYGWRTAFFGIGMLSLLFAIVIKFVFSEPPRDPEFYEGRTEEKQGLLRTVLGEVKKMWLYLRVPTFLVLVGQGMAGATPWSALSFLTMWYQYAGFSDGQAGTLVGIGGFVNMWGNLLGGVVADVLNNISRYHGRIAAAQFSVSCGLIVYPIILLVVPKDTSYFAVFIALQVFFGLTATWCGNASNKPIMLEIVDARNRGSIVAMQAALEGAAAAVFGAPLVGFIAEDVFHYDTSIGSDDVKDMPTEERESNLDALTNALVITTVVPWGICFIAYTFLHYTYKKDIIRVLRQRELWAQEKEERKTRLDSIEEVDEEEEKSAKPPSPPTEGGLTRSMSVEEEVEVKGGGW